MDKKTRNGYYLSEKIQTAIKIVWEKERVNPSNQVELALIGYLNGKYKALLKEHDITL